MNNELEPMLPLTTPARHYWRILAGMMTGAWDEIDNLAACVACHAFALIEELAQVDEAGCMADVCRRTHDGLRPLNLNVAKIAEATDPRAKIVRMVVVGV